MDWPVIGAVSATILMAGAVTLEVVVFMQPEPAPIMPELRLARLFERDRNLQSESPAPRPAELTEPDPMPTSPMAADPERTASQNAHTASAPARLSPSSEVSSARPPREFKAARLTLPEPQPRVEQWRVVVTAGANYYNLGGHVDRTGIADELASSHLRDALKGLRNFARLPPELRTHILTQNISLPKLAPYRGLLGMNDRTLEEEQAIRFERVVSSR